MIPLLLALAISAPTGCILVDSSDIRAADLAGAQAAFGSLPPHQVIAPAPLPGASRLFTENSVRSLLMRFRLPVPDQAGEFCVERKVAQLDHESILAAVRRGLAGRNARVEVVDFSRYPVPHGRLEFPIAGLSRAGAAGPVRWKGLVRDAGGHEYPVWADVRLSATCTRVVAVETLPARKPVIDQQLRIETYEGIPFESGEGHTVEEFIGRTPVRHVPAGAVLQPAMMSRAVDIERGQSVTVEARSRNFRVKTEGIADGSGSRGDLIAVKNQTSGKKFRARVESKTLVVIDVDPPSRAFSGGIR